MARHGASRFFQAILNFSQMMDNEKHKILFVDNERGFLEPLKEFFEEKNYQVFLAKSGEEGVQVIKSQGPFSAIISDQRMPQMMGIEFLKIAMKESPHTPRILITAFQDSQVASESVNEAEVFAFMAKPIELNELNKIVRTAIKKYESALTTIQKHKILFLGEKIGLTDETQNALLTRGHNFEFIRSGRDLMEIINKKIPIAVIVFYYFLHNRGELEYFKHLKKLFPKSTRVLLTNRATLTGITSLINEVGVYKILTSPFDINELDLTLKESLQKYDQLLGESLVNHQNRE